MYIIDDKIECKTAEEAAAYVVGGIEWDDELFDEEIDELYPEIEVFGAHYLISYVIKTVDPIAYRCAKAEWDDSKNAEYIDETAAKLERMCDGEEIELYGYTVRYIEEVEE